MLMERRLFPYQNQKGEEFTTEKQNSLSFMRDLCQKDSELIFGHFFLVNERDDGFYVREWKDKRQQSHL